MKFLESSLCTVFGCLRQAKGICAFLNNNNNDNSNHATVATPKPHLGLGTTRKKMSEKHVLLSYVAFREQTERCLLTKCFLHSKSA